MSAAGIPVSVVRVGLVLGAGGLVGEAFHRGVIRALGEVVGWDMRQADVVVGTSAGALMAASLRASGHPVPAVPRAAAAIPDGPVPTNGRFGGLPSALTGPLPALGALVGAALRPWQARFGVLASSVVPRGNRPLDFLVDGLDDRFGEHWPERSTRVVAVRRRDGRRVVFGAAGAPRVRMSEAVAASCAVPGYFRPVTIAGEEYVDGGAHSPTNADLLAYDDLDCVVISSPMSVDPSALRPRLDLSLRLAWHRYVVAEARAVRRSGAAVVVIEPGGDLLGPMGFNLLRADQIDEVEERALARARTRFEQALGTGHLLLGPLDDAEGRTLRGAAAAPFARRG